MEGQINLFEETNLAVVEGGRKEISEKEYLKCFKSELKSVDYLSLEDLFSGFNSIKAITFSYDIDFINQIITSEEAIKLDNEYSGLLFKSID